MTLEVNMTKEYVGGIFYTRSSCMRVHPKTNWVCNLKTRFKDIIGSKCQNEF